MRKSQAALAIVASLMFTPAMAVELSPGTPEAQGFSSEKLAGLVSGAGSSGLPIHSLLVMRHGAVVIDAAFYPFDGTSLHDIASVTKSVTTTLIGIAAGEGSLDLDAPMISFFPGRSIANMSEQKRRVTVRHLTRNLSGLACIGYPEEITLAQMQQSADFVQFALDLPMIGEPGTRFDYCSPGMHILSAILTQVTGKTALDYARDRIFNPLDITNVAWDADPQGTTRGWGDLHLSPQDMLKLGLLWMQGGAWKGRQLIPADWLRSATTESVRSDRREDYGAGFWIGPVSEPIPYFFASGRGGQRILAVPALDLLVVTTGGGFDPGSVIDPLAGALVDPANPLPPDPAGEARLAEAIRSVAGPPVPKPAESLPAIARAVDGKVFRFAPNAAGIVSLRLDFAGDAEATMTLVTRDDATPRQIGFDGIYRWSPGAHGIPTGIRANWEDEQTLVIDYNTVADIRAYLITARLAESSIALTIEQRDEPLLLRLTGQSDQQ